MSDPEGPARPVWRAPGMRDLATVSFAGFSGVMVLLPVAPLWAVHGGAGTAGSGLVNGVMLAGTVLTQLLVPRALARFGWASVLTLGLALLGVPALLYTTSDSLAVVLALSAARGAGFGLLTVTGSSVVVRLVEPARRGEAIGLYGLAVAVPNLLVLPVGPWLAEHVGFWLTFLVGAAPLLGIASAHRLARVVAAGEAADARTARPRPDRDDEPVWTARLRLLPPTLVLLSVTLAGGALITFMPQMVGAGWLTAVALFVMGLLAALARWRAGIVADRVGAHRFLWPLLLLAAAGTALVAWSVADPDSTRAWALLIGVAVVGLGYGALQNLTLVVAFEVVSPARRDLASSTWNIGFDGGTALGSVVVGALASAASFPPALLVAAAVTVAALPLAWRRPALSVSA